MNSKRVLGLAFGLGATAWAGGPVKHVRLLHMSDSHAQLETHWEYTPEKGDQLVRMGGHARIKTLLDRLRKGAPGAVFTADGGDTFRDPRSPHGPKERPFWSPSTPWALMWASREIGKWSTAPKPSGA